MPAPLVERVEPSKERPLPISRDLMAEEPLPTRIPPSGVEEAVPPPAIARVPDIVGAKVKAPAVFVMLRPTVWPLVVCEEVAKVIAPVCDVAPPRCWRDETPADASPPMHVPPI